jgi:hypothetical protein
MLALIILAAWRRQTRQSVRWQIRQSQSPIRLLVLVALPLVRLRLTLLGLALLGLVVQVRLRPLLQLQERLQGQQRRPALLVGPELLAVRLPVLPGLQAVFPALRGQ